MSSDESQLLSQPNQPAPVSQRAAAACFRSASAVTAVRSRGDDLFVTFVGARQPTEIMVRRTDDAAIRYAYAHGTPSNILGNANWFHAPADWTRSDSSALNRCLPQ